MATSLAVRREKKEREQQHKEFKNKLVLIVKKEPGLSSSQYAKIVDKRPSDINKLLRKLAYDGVVYSMPHTNGKHSWHLNALDHNKTKTKVMCRAWDINVLK